MHCKWFCFLLDLFVAALRGLFSTDDDQRGLYENDSHHEDTLFIRIVLSSAFVMAVIFVQASLIVIRGEESS